MIGPFNCSPLQQQQQGSFPRFDINPPKRRLASNIGLSEARFQAKSKHQVIARSETPGLHSESELDPESMGMLPMSPPMPKHSTQQQARHGKSEMKSSIPGAWHAHFGILSIFGSCFPFFFSSPFLTQWKRPQFGRCVDNHAKGTYDARISSNPVLTTPKDLESCDSSKHKGPKCNAKWDRRPFCFLAKLCQVRPSI